MTLERETAIALAILRADLQEGGSYVEDARAGAKLGNSIVGLILNLTHGVPRQYAEAAVVIALRKLDVEREGGAP